MVLVALALLAAEPTQAPSMSVADFLAKVDSLQRKGVLAMFSGDVGLIKAEAKLDLDAFAAQLIAAIKSHQDPPACPPKVGSGFKFSFTSDEVLQYFRTLPPQRRSTSSKEAFAAFMATKYPCRR